MIEVNDSYKLVDTIQRLRTYPTKEELDLINEVIEEIEEYFLDHIESVRDRP